MGLLCLVYDLTIRLLHPAGLTRFSLVSHRLFP